MSNDESKSELRIERKEKSKRERERERKDSKLKWKSWTIFGPCYARRIKSKLTDRTND